MTTPSLKSRIASGDECFGLFCSIPSAVALEQVAAAGYDFAIIDLEHTLISPEQLEALILAARATQLQVLVRVPPQAPHLVLQLLDAGVAGIVFARVDDAAQAQQAVELCHYGPQGMRGLNATRASRYGLDGLLEATQQAANDTLVVVMVESQQGLDNADTIAAVAGVDVVLEGAADLSQALGLTWQTGHPRVRTAVEQVCAATQAAGKTFCAIPRELRDMQRWRSHQVSMFVIGDDRGIMRRAHLAHLTAHKE